MATEDENAHALAEGIRSIGMANALQWAAVAVLLENGGVLPQEKFAGIAAHLAQWLEDRSEDNAAGVAMLRQVQQLIRREAPNAGAKWKPTVVR